MTRTQAQLCAQADSHHDVVDRSARQRCADRMTHGALVPYSHEEVHTYEGGTSSDHKPILSVLSCERKEQVKGRNIHWRVVSLFLSYVIPYWVRQWKYDAWDDTYKKYVTFLALVIARCTVYFPLNKYRIAFYHRKFARASHTAEHSPFESAGRGTWS